MESRSQWPRGLRRRSADARLLRSWVRIPPGAWMFVCFECCVLWGRGLCDELITRPEESYRLWCVVVCDLESSWMRRSWPALGCSANRKKIFMETFDRNRHNFLFCFQGIILCKRKANWVGHILRRNCLLQRVIEGKIKGGYKRQEDEEKDEGSNWMT